MKRAKPLYDRRRFEALVTAHKAYAHKVTKSAKRQGVVTGVKAPR